jgi:acetyl esterase/lipase
VTAAPPSIGLHRYLPPPAPRPGHAGSRHHAGATYAAQSGYRPLKLDLWVPDRPTPPPLVVWIHGGAWMIGDRRLLPGSLRQDQVFEELVDAGLAVATIDYRHAREAAFPAQLHDAKAAVRWLRAHADPLGIDATRIGVWGESAGGHLAALLALTAHRADLEGDLGVVGPSSGIDAVVDWYGVSDLGSMVHREPPAEIRALLPPEDLVPPLGILLAGADQAIRSAADPTSHVRPGAPPFLLVHGDADPVVPHQQSEVLAAALAGAGVEARLETVPGAGHGLDSCADVDAVVRLSVDFLVRALRRSAP